MKYKSLFSGLILSLMVVATFFSIAKVFAATTVIIKNINSTNQEVELTNTSNIDINLSGWKIVQQNLPVSEADPSISTDLSGTISAEGDKIITVSNLGVNGAVFYLYDQENNLVMSATISLEEIPIISGVSPVSGSRVGSLTTLNFSSSKFNDPGCQVDGLNWGNPCRGLTFAAIPGWGNVSEGPFTLTIRDTNSAGAEGRLDVSYIKDITAPVFVSAVASEATTINITLSENLQSDLVTSDFIVSSTAGDNPIISATVDGAVITLRLQNAFLNTDSIVLNINPFKPISIKDLVGNEFVPLETISVSNTIPEVVVVVPTVPTGGSSGGGSSRATGYVVLPTENPLGGQVLGTIIFRFTRNLSYGQRHHDVVELQKRLMKEGFMASSTPTDLFGPKTLAAVKFYQKKNKLPMAGYVGPMTRSVLNGWFAKNRPINNLANITEQELLNLQNLLNILLSKIRK